MYKASYNSLFLRFLWTGEDGSRFRSSGGRSFPWDSSQAFSSRIFRLFARSEREGWTHKAIRGTNNKKKQKHPSQEAAGKRCFNCIFRLLSYSLNCTCCSKSLSGESMKTRPGQSETAAAQISRKRTIRQPSFLRPSWSKEQNRAESVHMYCCFIF